MGKAVVDIKRWGNALWIPLPAAVACSARLSAHQRVRVSVEGDQVVITPIALKELTLAQRLALFDPACHGGEALATSPIGAERW